MFFFIFSEFSKKLMKLFDWQITGTLWSLRQESDPLFKGGIMADEMGMGKTIQMIAVMKKNVKHSTLIILPKSLIRQWICQIRTFSSDQSNLLSAKNLFNVVHYPHDDPMLLCLSNTHNPAVVVTSYEAVSREQYFNRSNLLDYHWGRLVMDEFHVMKNPKSKRYKLFQEFDAEIKWGMTGTPLQNHHGELEHLSRLLGMPYSSTYIRQKIIRRTIQNTPEINEAMPQLQWNIIRLPFVSKRERNFYVKIMNNYHHEMNGLSIDNKMVLYLRLQQLLVNPKLIMEYLSPSERPHEMTEEWTGTTTKYSYIMKDIEETDKPTIIFCKYVKEIELLHEGISALGRSVERLDGSTSAAVREELLLRIAEKRDLPFVLLIQIRSGGVGLNLQYYTRIIVSTSDWNPAVQQQAIARSFRLGQTEPVEANMLCVTDQYSGIHTLDEVVLDRLKNKTESVTEAYDFIPKTLQQVNTMNTSILDELSDSVIEFVCDLCGQIGVNNNTDWNECKHKICLRCSDDSCPVCTFAP